MRPTPIPTDDSKPGAEQGQEATATDDSLMAELAIIRAGRYYFYGGYRYDRLPDAIAYARLVRGKAHRPGPSSPTTFESVDPPTASDRQLMMELSISPEGGRFVFEGFHYDRLVDAANYARHRRSSAATQ